MSKAFVFAITLAATLFSAAATSIGPFVGTWTNEEGRYFYLCSNSDIASGKNNAFFGLGSPTDPQFLVGFGLGQVSIENGGNYSFYGKNIFGGPYLNTIGWNYDSQTKTWNALTEAMTTYMTLTQINSTMPDPTLCFMPWNAQKGAVDPSASLVGQWKGVDASVGTDDEYYSSMCSSAIGWYNYPAQGYNGRFKEGKLIEDNQIWFGSWSEDDNNEFPHSQGSEFWVLVSPTEMRGFWLDGLPNFRRGLNDVSEYGGKSHNVKRTNYDSFFDAQCAVRVFEYACPVRQYFKFSPKKDGYMSYSLGDSSFSNLYGRYTDGNGHTFDICTSEYSPYVYVSYFDTYESVKLGYGIAALYDDGSLTGYFFDTGLYLNTFEFTSPMSDSVVMSFPILDINFTLMRTNGTTSPECIMPYTDGSEWSNYKSYNNLVGTWASTDVFVGPFSGTANSTAHLCDSGMGNFEGTIQVSYGGATMTYPYNGMVSHGTFFFGSKIYVGVYSFNDPRLPADPNGLPTAQGSTITIQTSMNDYRGFYHEPATGAFGKSPYGPGGVKYGQRLNDDGYCTNGGVAGLSCAGRSNPFSAVPAGVYIFLGGVFGFIMLMALIKTIAG